MTERVYKCGKCGETGHNARTCGAEAAAPPPPPKKKSKTETKVPPPPPTKTKPKTEKVEKPTKPPVKKAKKAKDTRKMRGYLLDDSHEEVIFAYCDLRGIRSTTGKSKALREILENLTESRLKKLVKAAKDADADTEAA